VRAAPSSRESLAELRGARVHARLTQVARGAVSPRRTGARGAPWPRVSP
jgi:hypothetical protein